MNNSYTIIFTSGVQSIEISPESSARLIEGGLSGFDCTGFDVRINSYAGGIGGYATKRRFAERELSITFELLGGGERSDKLRRKIVSMMNPENDCTLEITLYGVSRKIGVIPCAESVFTRGVLSDSIEASLTFVAPAVFFEDSCAQVVHFRDSAPILTFPLNLISGAGTTAGIYRTTDSASADNPGDGECGILAEIRASGGNVINPGIKLGEKYVKCPLTLENGHTLTIDTRARRKNILLDGERYFSFDRGSTFFSLPAGKSTVSVTCDLGGEYIDARIEYTPLYFGM